MELIRLIKRNSTYSKVCQDKSQTTSLLVRVQITLVGNLNMFNCTILLRKTDFLKAKMSTNGISLPYSMMTLIMINGRGYTIFEIWNLN